MRSACSTKPIAASNRHRSFLYSYLQALLLLSRAAPVFSTEPLFLEITWPGGEYQVFRAVLADHHYVIHRGVNRLIPE